jgi:hypothetical protein
VIQIVYKFMATSQYLTKNGTIGKLVDKNGNKTG